MEEAEVVLMFAMVFNSYAEQQNMDISTGLQTSWY